MKNAMETFGDSKVAKMANKVVVATPKFELPPEPMPGGDERNAFEEIGKALCYIYQGSFLEHGYVDLDGCWTMCDPSVVTEAVFPEDDSDPNEQKWDPKLVQQFLKNVKEYKTKYEKPFQGHKAYYTQVKLDVSGIDAMSKKTVVVFGDFSDRQKNKVTGAEEAMPNGRKRVTFWINTFKKESLGYKPKPAALGGDTSEEAEYKQISFFLEAIAQAEILNGIQATQEADGEFRETEFGYIISPEIKVDGKYLKGYCNAFWC